MVKREAPIGLKIIVILFFIGGVYSIITGIFGFQEYSKFISQQQYGSDDPRYTELLITGIFAIILGAVGGIAQLLSGIFLWKGRKWARILGILIIFIWIASFLKPLFQGIVFGNLALLGSSIIGTIASIIAIFYLLFNKKVREFFR